MQQINHISWENSYFKQSIEFAEQHTNAKKEEREKNTHTHTKKVEHQNDQKWCSCMASFCIIFGLFICVECDCSDYFSDFVCLPSVNRRQQKQPKTTTTATTTTTTVCFAHSIMRYNSNYTEGFEICLLLNSGCDYF